MSLELVTESRPQEERVFTREDILDACGYDYGAYKRVVFGTLRDGDEETRVVIKFPKGQEGPWLEEQFYDEPEGAKKLKELIPKHVPQYRGVYKGRAGRDGRIYEEVDGISLRKAREIIEPEDIDRFTDAIELAAQHGLFVNGDVLLTHNLVFGRLPDNEREANIVLVETHLTTPESYCERMKFIPSPEYMELIRQELSDALKVQLADIRDYLGVEI